MSSVTMQRDLIVSLKKETCLNVGILSKLQPMPSELSRQMFKENVLEKPTQNLFNHLSYYLVCIVDTKVATALPWPLYDTKTERAYRSEFSSFLNDYSNKGLLSPVMSSYLVNPGCYKVVMLMFQLSQLAVQRVLLSKMQKNRQKELYDEMTDKYKENKEGFVETIEKETEIMLSKFSNYLHKRNAMARIAEIFRSRITDMEAKLVSLNTQKYLDTLVDGYLTNHPADEGLGMEIFKIKNVNSSTKYFDMWLTEFDEKMDRLEKEWTKKVSPFLETCKQTREHTEQLIARHTGEADKNSYMIEYNPNTDEICTKELQDQVNSQQKYILKNIIKENRLNFPNLIRGFLISICFMLKNTEIGDEIYKFNEYLESGRRNYRELVSAMRTLVERVLSAESRLEPSPLLIDSSMSIKEFAEIPPLPDLSDLKANRDAHCQILFDTFTPFSISKHQFNLHRKTYNSFGKNQPKSLLSAPYYQPPRDDFLKSLISCRVSSYDQNNISSLHNISVISHAPSRANETIAECSSGFTKQQILRLLSTKKSSSSKKFKYKTERPLIKVKKGGLFNESDQSNESNGSNGLYRSHSSPNLFENRDKRSYNKLSKRKLSIMQEDMPSLLEVSGITKLEKDSFVTPKTIKKDQFIQIDTTSLPSIMITKESENKINNILRDIETDMNEEIKQTQPVLKNDRKSVEIKEDFKTETPKMNAQLVRKTSSLEKIINRFKKVKANVLQDTNKEGNEFKTIAEEKENFNSVNVDVFTANRVLLPDLLSPSCSVLTMKSDYLENLCFDIEEKEQRRPRESLGTALGVDQTFLDQFDLID